MILNNEIDHKIMGTTLFFAGNHWRYCGGYFECQNYFQRAFYLPPTGRVSVGPSYLV